MKGFWTRDFKRTSNATIGRKKSQIHTHRNRLDCFSIVAFVVYIDLEFISQCLQNVMWRFECSSSSLFCPNFSSCLLIVSFCHNFPSPSLSLSFALSPCLSTSHSSLPFLLCCSFCPNPFLYLPLSFFLLPCLLFPSCLSPLGVYFLLGSSFDFSFI